MSTKIEEHIPDLSSDEWTVLRTVHVGVKGHLEVLWGHENRWVKVGDTNKSIMLVHTQYIVHFCRRQ